VVPVAHALVAGRSVWFVHTEIDAMSTYIGGSHEMIDSLVGQQILEPFEVEEDTPAAL
jgi:hypothetical protein